MASQALTLGLNVTDWLGLIFFALLFLVLMIFFRPPGRRNHISIEAANNSPIYIDQSDQSTRQTQVSVKVKARVNLPAKAPPMPTPQPVRTANPNASGEGAQTAVGIGAALLFLGTSFYLREFSLIVLITRGFFLGLTAYSLLGLLAGSTRWIEPVDGHYRWFLVHAVVGMAGAAVLWNAQALIDPHVLSVARDMPLSIDGAIQVQRQLTWPERFNSLASFTMCALTMFAALLNGAAIWRSYILSFWDDTSRGWLARAALRLLPAADEPRHIALSVMPLAMALALRYIWLPNALQP